MLRSTDGSTRGGRRSLAGMAAGCAIVLAAVATTALRSRVEAMEANGAAKVVERTLFGEPGPDLSFMGPVDIGLVVLQLDDFAKMKEFALATDIAEGFLNSQVEAMKQQGVNVPQLKFSQIDYIAYSMHNLTEEEAELLQLDTIAPENGEVALMLCEFAIRWVEPTDGATWIASWVPKAEVVDENGFRYVRVEPDGNIDASYYLAQRDPHTIVASYSVDRVRKLALEDGPKHSTPLKTLSGGLVACQLNLRALPEGTDLDSLLRESPLGIFGAGTVAVGEINPLVEARKAISQATDAIFVGLDFQPNTQQVGVRAAFSAKDEAAAESVSSSLQVFQAIWQAMHDESEKELATNPALVHALDEQTRALNESVVAGMRMLAEGKCTVRPRGAEGADAWVEMTGELPDSARAYLTGGAEAAGYRDGVISAAGQPVRMMPPVVRAADGGPESPGLFARSDDASMLLGNAEQGAFVIRVSELAQVPAFAQAAPMLNAMIRQQLEQQTNVSLQDIPEIHVEAIEWIAGVPRLKIKPKTGTEKEQEGQMMFECDGFVVRFRDKVDWKSWLARALPATEEYESVRGEKLNYLELPPIPGNTGFGDLQFMVAARDERTLVVATDVEQLRQLAKSTGADAHAGLGFEWKELDGGLATLIAKIDVNGPLGLPDEPGARLTESILQKSSEFGLAFDTDPVTRAAQVRLTLTAADPAAAEQIKATLEEMLPMFAAQLEAELLNPTQLHVDPNAPYRAVQTVGDANTNRQIGEFWLAIFKDCTPQIVPRADGRVQVQLTATTTLPSSLMVSYEYEQKDAAEENAATERR